MRITVPIVHLAVFRASLNTTNRQLARTQPCLYSFNSRIHQHARGENATDIYGELGDAGKQDGRPPQLIVVEHKQQTEEAGADASMSDPYHVKVPPTLLDW